MPDFNEFGVSKHTSIKSPIPNFRKIRLAVAAMIHADRRTEIQSYEHDEDNFCDYANAPKNQSSYETPKITNV